ncbi:hypothetical protein NMY22_g12581 [Coprinellus aureogranulatus]|nr:hypothetical protein NMY22_g12581 [Coprinellus aureogranulatus]
MVEKTFSSVPYNVSARNKEFEGEWGGAALSVESKQQWLRGAQKAAQAFSGSARIFPRVRAPVFSDTSTCCRQWTALNRASRSSPHPAMDPQRPESFNHRRELLSTGRTYHFIDQLPENYDPKRHPTLLCIHGFPDSWYGWRYQIGPWVRRGCRVVAPDMLGYGDTSKPTDPEEYTTRKLCADLAALLDILGVRRAVVIGHDWGSYTAGRFALWQPNRLLALVMISVPYTPPSKDYISLPEVVKRAPNYGYQLYINDPRSSEEIDAHLPTFVDIMYKALGKVPNFNLNFTREGALRKILHDPATPKDLPSVLNEQERAFYIQELGKGMHGPLNYYRTTLHRFEEEKAAGLTPQFPSNLPYLFIWGTKDPTVVAPVIAKAQKFIPRYQDIAIEGRGHWLMVEAKEEVTEHIGNWLDELTCTRPRTAQMNSELLRGVIATHQPRAHLATASQTTSFCPIPSFDDQNHGIFAAVPARSSQRSQRTYIRPRPFSPPDLPRVQGPQPSNRRGVWLGRPRLRELWLGAG